MLKGKKKSLKFKLNEKVTVYPEEVAESDAATFLQCEKLEKLKVQQWWWSIFVRNVKDLCFPSLTNIVLSLARWKQPVFYKSVLDVSL